MVFSKSVGKNRISLRAYRDANDRVAGRRSFGRGRGVVVVEEGIDTGRVWEGHAGENALLIDVNDCAAIL